MTKIHNQFAYITFCLFLAYIKCTDVATESIIQKYSLALQTLAYCSKTALGENIPDGCTIITVSDKCEVHLLLKGLIEPSKEITKLQKKIDFLKSTEKKLTQAMNAADYTTKVPADVQQSNADKLSQATTEIARLEAAIVSLNKMG